MKYLCQKSLTIKNCEQLYQDIENLRKIINLNSDTEQVRLACLKLKDLSFLARQAVVRTKKSKIKSII